MHRRRVLKMAPYVATTGIGGCLENTRGNQPKSTAGNGSESTRNSGKSIASDDNRISVLVYNYTNFEKSVSLIVIKEDRDIVSSDMTIASDEENSIDSGISEEGLYELKVTVDENEKNFEFNIERFHLKNGRDIRVKIEEKVIRAVIEE